MKFNKKLSLAVLVVIVAVAFAAIMPLTAESGKFTLKVLHTNDTHARLKEGKYDGMGFAKLATKVKEVRANNDAVLLLDAGDFVHGQPIATISKGEAIIPLLDKLGYDAITVGNHEFDYGRSQLQKLIGMTKVPFVSANLYKTSFFFFKSRMTKPYIIKDVKGVKIGIFGLTTPESYFKSHPKNVKGVTIKDPAPIAKEMVAELKGKGCTVIIALTHLGMDQETKEQWRSTYLAENVEGIDLIVDGHSHDKIPNGKKVGNTLIVMAHEYDKALGMVDMEIDNGKVVSVSASYFTKDQAASTKEDPQVKAFIDSVAEQNKKITSKVIGKTDIELVGAKPKVRTGETNLGNLITDAILWKTNADCVITNGGGIRTSIDKGEITKGEVITVLPFGNVVVVKELTGKQLKAALEHGVADYPEVAGKFPHIAGMTFTLDATAPAGQRVKDLKVNGKAVDMNKKYSVATNDFLAAGGDGYAAFANAKEVKLYSNMDEILIEYIQDNGTVDADLAKVDGRITVKK